MSGEDWAEFQYLIPVDQEIQLSEVVDVKEIQSLMDDFYSFTGIGMAMVDIEGNVLVATGWQDICTQFHRKHPETLKNCIESDTELSSGLEKGCFKLYHCKNNMWDVATPIIIDGKHVGNVFCGQFFLEGEKPDYDFFRTQARKYGFDEKEYIMALDKVPCFDEETVTSVMHFYSKLASIISEMGRANFLSKQVISQQSDLLAHLRFHLGLQDIVAGISSLFMNADLDSIDDVIDTALMRLGRYYGVDRGYVFMFSCGDGVMTNTHEWCADGIKPQIDRTQELPVGSLPWITDKIRRGSPVHIPDIEALPAEADAEKEEFRTQEIKSLICFPLPWKGSTIGFFGFDSIHSPRRWPDEQIKLLGVVAEIIAGAMKRNCTA